jgi:hypothetical protein
MQADILGPSGPCSRPFSLFHICTQVSGIKFGAAGLCFYTHVFLASSVILFHAFVSQILSAVDHASYTTAEDA